MYTFSNKLKTFSIILMVLGALGVGYGFMASHKSFEEVETILAAESTGHGGGHAEEASPMETSHAVENSSGDSETAQVDEHKEHVNHVKHQIENRPWSALYVAAFFFIDDSAWCF